MLDKSVFMFYTGGSSMFANCGARGKVFTLDRGVRKGRRVGLEGGRIRNGCFVSNVMQRME